MSIQLLSAKHFNTTKAVLERTSKEDNFIYYIEPFYEGEIDWDDFFETMITLNIVTYFLKYRDELENGFIVNVEIQKIIRDKRISPRGIMCPEDLVNALRSISYNIEVSHLDGIRELTEKETMYLELLKMLPYIISNYYLTQSAKYINSKAWSIE